MEIQVVMGKTNYYSMNVASSLTRESSQTQETLDSVEFDSLKGAASGISAIRSAITTVFREGQVNGLDNIDTLKIGDSITTTSMAQEMINFTSRSILAQAANAISAQSTNISAQMVSYLQA